MSKTPYVHTINYCFNIAVEHGSDVDRRTSDNFESVWPQLVNAAVTTISRFPCAVYTNL